MKCQESRELGVLSCVGPGLMVKGRLCGRDNMLRGLFDKGAF